jgi:hypothetical protein
MPITTVPPLDYLAATRLRLGLPARPTPLEAAAARMRATFGPSDPYHRAVLLGRALDPARADRR